MHRETEAELLGQLAQLDARITELRGARSAIVYDLEWALRERERIRCHLRDVPLLDPDLLKEDGEGLDGAA